VEQWKRSGQSAAAYAAQIGVHATTFGSWVRKLQQGDPESGSEQATGGSRSAAGVSFVELVAPLEAAGAERFEVVLRSGVQLRVPVGFQSEALRRLLDVLELR
jgi:transposase-like protein